jgi:hypothetical protein
VYFVSYRDPVHGVDLAALVRPHHLLSILHPVIQSYFEIYSPYQDRNRRSEKVICRYDCKIDTFILYVFNIVLTIKTLGSCKNMKSCKTKNQFPRNQKRVNKNLANQNSRYLKGRKGPAMTYRTNQNILRNVATYPRLSVILSSIILIV